MKIWMIEPTIKPGCAAAIVSAVSEDNAWDEACKEINKIVNGIGWKPYEGEKKKEMRKEYKIIEIVSETPEVFFIDSEWF